MMTSQQEADELLHQWQERRGRGVAPQCRLDTQGEINDRAAIIPPEFGVFIFLVSLREELRARKGTATRAKPLPRYVERDRNRKLWFRVDRGPRIALPRDPASLEFRRAYSEALVDAIAAESDRDDWTELQRHHELQRRQRTETKVLT
jgi:hypothetical protein